MQMQHIAAVTVEGGADLHPNAVAHRNRTHSSSKQAPTCKQHQKLLLCMTAQTQSSSAEAGGRDPSLTYISVILLTTEK